MGGVEVASKYFFFCFKMVNLLLRSAYLLHNKLNCISTKKQKTKKKKKKKKKKHGELDCSIVCCCADF